MPSPRRRAWILTAGVLALTACKSEPDNKPAADPLEDPWVDALDTGDPQQPVGAATEAAPSGEPASADEPAALALAEADPATDPEPAAAPEPAAGVIASPSAAADSSKPKSAASTQPSASANTAGPAPSSEAPSEPPSEQPAIAQPEPAPSAEPAPAPSVEPAEPPAPPPITIADFHGNYRFVGGATQRADLEAAIEAAANQLSAAIRGIGRKRLTKTNPIDDTLDIVIAGDKVTTIFETGFDATCVIDGPTVKWSNKKGDSYKVRVRAKGSKLVQIIEGDDGVKTTVFVLSADKKRLTVHHKITADRLKEPMTYRLSYSRK